MHGLGGEDFFLEEELGPQKKHLGVIRKLFPYFRNYLKKIITALLLLLSSTILALLGPVLIKHVIDIEIPRKNLKGILIIAFFYLVVQVFIIFVRYFQQIEIATVGEKAIADLKSDLFKRMVKLPVPFFDRNPVGRLITRIESDTETLKNLFSSTAVVLASNLTLLLGMAVVMLIVNVRLFLLVFIMLPVFIYAFWWFGKNVRPVYLLLRRKIAEINSFIVESIRGASIIQAFLQEDGFTAKVNTLGKDKFDLEIRAMSFWYRIWFLVELGEVVGIILIVGIGGIWALKGMLTIGALFLFLNYITRLFGPLRGLSDQINIIERALASAERVFGIMSLQEETTPLEEKTVEHLKDGIEFKNISFGYETENLVLENITFKIKRGERIALVGETGGGKTSIVSLLLKLYKAQAGEILIDDIEISKLRRDSLRAKIGFVPQDVVLFPGSILENLRLFDETIQPDRVFSAAQRAKVHDRILGFPQGYETNIIEQGINLSFGEKQLLSFARALVFDPEILVLDEATSAVDPECERIVQEGMKELLENRTAIIIAHRLMTTRLADRILVIHKGRLIEEGSHRDLIARHGFYNKLYRLQYLDGQS